MGIIINEVCCIDSSFVTDYNNSNNFSSIYGEAGKNSSKNISNNHSSTAKPFPSNEINISGPNNTGISLSNVPINTSNVIRRQSGNPLEDYTIAKKLGKGSFGKVYKVLNKKTGMIRAMKVIPRNNLRCGFTEEDIIQEINILKKLEHPHIIKIYEFYSYKKNYYLINEFCTDGDLSDKLNKLKYFPEFIVKILMIQIFNAVMYLNKNCVIHGDLKLENIMIDSFLKEDELTLVKDKKYSFIQSLLEDEKEINEYLKQNEIKRSCTFYSKNRFKFNIKENKIENKKENHKENHKENQNENHKDNNNIINKNDFKTEDMKNDDNEIFTRKRGRTIAKHSLFKNNNNEIIYDNKIKNDIKSTKVLNNITINGQNEKNTDNNYYKKIDEKKNEQDKNCMLINNEEIENGNSKINNIIKVYNEDNNNYQKYIIEHTQKKINAQNIDTNQQNSNIKRTLSLSTMKMKNFELKLIDFGCSKIFSKYKKNFQDTIGTLIYCSPEVLKNNYDKQCDIWSCGVIMYVLLCGEFPFFGKTGEEIKKKILSGKFNFNNKRFSKVSEKAKDLIKKCLIYDKDQRITAEEALKHEFFADDINPNNIFEDEIDSKNVLISLKNYSQQSKIYQAVLAFLSHNFADKAELNKLKKIFYKIDLNLDGKLSKDELYMAFKEAGMEMENDQLNKVIESIDFDGNGFIEYEEFIRVTLPKEQLFTEKNLKSAFDMFDLDKNGTISLNEFKEILGIKKIQDRKVNKELLKEIPIHGNEEMTFEQFKKILIG